MWQDELSGMFMWASASLSRCLEKKKFTTSLLFIFCFNSCQDSFVPEEMLHTSKESPRTTMIKKKTTHRNKKTKSLAPQRLRIKDPSWSQMIHCGSSSALSLVLHFPYYFCSMYSINSIDSISENAGKNKTNNTSNIWEYFYFLFLALTVLCMLNNILLHQLLSDFCSCNPIIRC